MIVINGNWSDVGRGLRIYRLDQTSVLVLCLEEVNLCGRRVKSRPWGKIMAPDEDLLFHRSQSEGGYSSWGEILMHYYCGCTVASTTCILAAFIRPRLHARPYPSPPTLHKAFIIYMPLPFLARTYSREIHIYTLPILIIHIPYSDRLNKKTKKMDCFYSPRLKRYAHRKSRLLKTRSAGGRREWWKMKPGLKKAIPTCNANCITSELKGLSLILVNSFPRAPRIHS
jgi:hypothetical protein